MARIDIALEELILLKKRFEEFKNSDITESDTRSKLIDYMFINALGWTESNITREQHVDSGYYDYMFSTVDFSFVVEAKKMMKPFVLPGTGNHCTLGTLEKGNKDIIDQIRKYLIDKSLAYGVVTNGQQYIVGKFVNTSGVDWRKTKVLFYRNLDEIESHFITFYNLLSKESIQNNRTISIGDDKETPQFIIDSLKASDQVLVRNDISSPLSKVISEAFGELTSDDADYEKKLLSNCYVINDDIKKYNSDLEVVFQDNPPTFDEKISKARHTSSIKDQLKQNLSDSSTHTETPPITIIIGGKGVGKTTFIKYFFSTMSKSERTLRPVVYIDFRNSTEQEIKDTEKQCGDILAKLKDNYPELSLHTDGVLRQIYTKEIKENKEGIWKHVSDNKGELDSKIATFLENKMSNSVSHLEFISKYLRDHCFKKICIVFDNADQSEEPAQRAAFLLAGSLQRKLKGIVLISLREGYYYRWKSKPPFDAFMSNVYHISAPPYKEVIRKRLSYVSNFFKFKEIETEHNNKRIKLTPDGFTDLFKNLELTLFGDQNSSVLEFLEETSYPNIRLGIEKLNKFLVSGHSKLYTYMTTERYRIPIWEFAKSIALESRLYYRHDKSLLINLFYPSKNGRSHFLKIRILFYILDKTDWVVHLDRFVAVKDICETFKLGDFPHSMILEELNDLQSANLIDTQSSISDIENGDVVPEQGLIKVTYQGSYYFKNILSEFYYYDLVLQDTPIYGSEHFLKIRSSFPESGSSNRSELSRRYETVQLFLDYLKNESEQEMKRLSNEGGDKCLSMNVFNEIIYTDRLKNSLRKIETKLKELQLPLER